ncbi:TPA: GPO family capsid scaffolding protein [Escherichia coli]|nr:GPO family capsid scaffolding protein [Escherichia coli]HDD9046540.1 GPO family capsid scaffolding protein [Escherichia coli]
MTVKAKRFRIGVEGATTDGREIQREWLEQMAASYNPAMYTALINLEQTISTQADELQSKSQALAKSNSQLISLSILTETNNREQARLYAEAEQTSALLRQRQHRIEELKRENEDLRRWADTPLPADIIRLRERPTLTGGAAYRQWLSASDAVLAGSGSAAH